MKRFLTKLWIVPATVVVAIATVVLIVVVHIAKTIQRTFSALTGKKRTEQHT